MSEPEVSATKEEFSDAMKMLAYFYEEFLFVPGACKRRIKELTEKYPVKDFTLSNGKPCED